MIKTPKKSKKTISMEIEHVLDHLSKSEPGSIEYTAAAANLQVLCDARSFKTSTSISMDTVMVVVGNLLGILAVINYENIHVISTKSINLLLRGRL